MSRRLQDPHLELLDDARHAQAVADRSQRRLLAEADDQDATFRGSLEDAAESGVVLMLETSVDRRIRGRVRLLSADHLVIEGSHGSAWVRLEALTVLRFGRDPTVRAGGGDRSQRPAVPLADALHRLVEHRDEVEVVFVGGTSARGVAVAIGRDVLTLHSESTDERHLVHLDRVALVLARPG